MRKGTGHNMEWRTFDELPKGMRHPEIEHYYGILEKRRQALLIKRCFDVFFSAFLLGLLAVPMLVIGLLIITDSRGGAFYRQVRVTQYGKRFRIHKFRTMRQDADRTGSAVTVSDDPRITRIGAFLRKYRLDELPQLIDVLEGNMSFVGTRPEVPRYVKKYTREMRATLLLPAGITSEASIRYKDEAELLDGAGDPDEVYVKKILPEKMRYNLQEIEHFGILRELRTMFETVRAVLMK